MPINTIEELKDYCLRKLGSPLINIEVDDVQLYERIDDAVEYFIERHYDGAEEVYYKQTIQRSDVENGYITLPGEIISISEVLKSKDSTSGEAMFDLEFRFMQDFNSRAGNMHLADYYLGMQHLSLISNLFSPDRSFEYNRAARRLLPHWKLSDVGSRNLLVDSNDITTSNWNTVNCIATSKDSTDPLGNTEAHTITTSAAGVFSISQTFSSKLYINGTLTFWVSLNPGSYGGDLTLSVKDTNGVVVGTTTITPPQYWKGQYVTVQYTPTNENDVTVEIQGTATAAGETLHVYNPWLYANAIIILHGYTALNPNIQVNVYDDRWLKEYTTALFKRQWGQNIKKFDGIQLPGGLTMNGQQIFQEAVEEIQRLEEKFSLEYELPVDMMMG